ncbi:MFS transporter [Neobacillus sp. PS3-34]|uniref:MFS transporter n=1 Tax=Neobacillus sp. PS3-34 TaxID=3070678 RepID=UPI0027E0EE31|nr:MFS transporter [Neobacillus sp. PS3-34]WML48175.1 MFS transporter [Neobacillus sp. PS3-34]
MNKPKLWTRNFVNVCLSSFFLFLTFYYLLVSLPIYVIQDLHGNPSKVGLVVTVFLVAAILIRPIAGQWIGKIGEKAVLMISLIIFTVASAFYFLPHTLIGLLILRFFHGLGFGIATTAAGTIVAEIIPDSRRGEGMGYYAMSMNLAMVAGPFLGLTAIQNWGTVWTFAIAFICASFALISGWFITLKTEKPGQVEVKKKVSAVRFQDLFEKSAIRISLVGALFALVYSSVLSFVSVYAKQLGLVEVASLFFVVYAVILLLSRPFTGKWFDLYGANVIIYPAIICFAVGMLLLSKASSASAFLISAGLIGMGWGTVFPSLQTIAIHEAPPKRRGLATATFLSIFDFGIGVGSYIVGFAGAKIGFSSLYFSGTFIVIAGLIVYFLLYGRKLSIQRKADGQ